MIPSVVGKSDKEVECLMVPTSSDRASHASYNIQERISAHDEEAMCFTLSNPPPTQADGHIIRLG